MPFHDDDEDDTTDTCPYCGAAIYDDAVRCPRCENYLSREDAPSRHPWWIVVTAIVCVLLVLGWILGRGW
jgi:predicted nucleic acid-binding Zn ribbon protein